MKQQQATDAWWAPGQTGAHGRIKGDPGLAENEESLADFERSDADASELSPVRGIS